MEQEQWKAVKGYEGLYEVSNTGKVKSLARYIDAPHNVKRYVDEHILKGCIKNEGYEFVTLTKDKQSKSYTVHRLVAEAFLPNPDNLPVINHKDEIKSNNNVDNLEWCTVLYNNTYNDRHWRIGEKHQIKVCQYNLNGELIKVWDGIRRVAEELNTDQSNISKVCRGKYKHLLHYVWRYEGDAFDKYETPKVRQPKEKKIKISPYSSSVVRFDYSGNIIKEYKSINEAAAELNITRQCILKCCRGELVTSCKSIWRFVGDKFDKYTTEKPKYSHKMSEEIKEKMRQIGLNSEYTKSVSKRVGKFTVDGELIKEYPSVTQAVKENKSGVIKVLQGEYKTTHGFVFKFL